MKLKKNEKEIEAERERGSQIGSAGFRFLRLGYKLRVNSEFFFHHLYFLFFFFSSNQLFSISNEREREGVRGREEKERGKKKEGKGNNYEKRKISQAEHDYLANTLWDSNGALCSSGSNGAKPSYLTSQQAYLPNPLMINPNLPSSRRSEVGEEEEVEIF